MGQDIAVSRRGPRSARGLAAAVAGTALALGVVAGAPGLVAAADPDIAGTWRVTLEIEGAAPTGAVYQYTADGRVVAILGESATAAGEWSTSGEDVVVTTVRPLEGGDGALTATVRERVTLDASGDGYASEGTWETRDAEGSLVATATLRATATRLRAAGPPTSVGEPTVIRAAGPNARAIRGAVDEYTLLLGGADNGGEPGSRATGFRTINWDKVPAAQSAPHGYLPDFFNAPTAPRARGAVLSSPAGTLQVSAGPDDPQGVPVRFGHINASYSDEFRAFSPEKLFSPVGSNVADLRFFVPGTDQPAVSRGFGAVYLDIDTEHTAFEYFDIEDVSLGTFAAPVADGGLSFLGVAFPEPVVHRVRIVYGTAPLGADDSPANDVAVMDDFFYGEPQPVGD